jgi:hypothetical protein
MILDEDEEVSAELVVAAKVEAEEEVGDEVEAVDRTAKLQLGSL